MHKLKTNEMVVFVVISYGYWPLLLFLFLIIGHGRCLIIIKHNNTHIRTNTNTHTHTHTHTKAHTKAHTHTHTHINTNHILRAL